MPKTTSTMQRAYHIPSSHGNEIDLGGIGVKFKLPAKATNGVFGVVEHPIKPGVFVEPHSHANEDEYSYVLEGTIGVRVGDDEFEARPGDWVVKPRNILHTFWNASKKPARILEIISPPPLLDFFDHLGTLLSSGAEPDKLGQLAETYGLSFDHSWVEDIKRRHGVTNMV